MRRGAAGVLLCIALSSNHAQGDDPPREPKKLNAWKAFRAGADMLGAAKNVAIAEGGYAIALHLNTALISRAWSSPYPEGAIGHWSTRLLYGGTWSVMMGLESMVVILANDGQLDWLAEATYRSDWVAMGDLPTCPQTGAFGGCGLGVGGFSYFQVRPLRSRFWFEAGGGWIQQRVLNDIDRTMTESSWVLSPLTVLYELKTDQEAPVSLRAFFGPGIFFGMHNAHLHPTEIGEARYKPSWHEMYPLDAGLGPGGRAELRIAFARRVFVTGEAVVAPLVLGGPTGQPSADIAPLDFPREGVSTWRRGAIGLGYYDRSMPFMTTLSFFAAELSERPIDRVGYKGMTLRLDVPLRVF